MIENELEILRLVLYGDISIYLIWVRSFFNKLKKFYNNFKNYFILLIKKMKNFKG